jgi:hypothetical protein
MVDGHRPDPPSQKAFRFELSSLPIWPPMLGVTPAARLYYRYLVLFVNEKLPTRANISRGPLVRPLKLNPSRSSINLSQDGPRRDPVQLEQYPQYKNHCTPQKKWEAAEPPGRHTFISHKRPDACQGTGVGEVTAPPAAPPNRCSCGCPHNLVSGGGVGITLPLSAAHSTEVPDDSPPLGWLDEAGSPSPSVSHLPVPGLLELCRAPLCIDALPATSITPSATPKKTIRAKVSNIVGLHNLSWVLVAQVLRQCLGRSKS